jgi:SAM-dependent methyltransferase
MKLHELVDFRNQLQKVFDSSIIKSEIDNNCSRLYNLGNKVDIEWKQIINHISKEHTNILEPLDTTQTQISELIQKVQERIDTLANKFFTKNYVLEFHKKIDEVRNDRVITKNEEFESNLVQRINLHSNWQYPALEIGCRDGEWTKYLVASDPLYIADNFPEFLTSAVEQFPDLYQGRVRKYLIEDLYKIKNLPTNTFGLIFSYNFFNYLSLDTIKQFLLQSMTWLRPGGKIIFTYNNADLPSGAGYAENFFMTYVPKSVLIPMAESLGYTTTFSYDDDPAYSIIEFQKPGELKSIKLSQVFGEIKIKELLQQN